jgi:hypothetical protein
VSKSSNLYLRKSLYLHNATFRVPVTRQRLDFSKNPNTVLLQKECQEATPESKSANFKIFANFASRILKLVPNVSQGIRT